MTVLTGFLGAGKTTLLKRLLTGDHGLRIAVLVNDFGALNIDADLVVGIESNVVSLANGCVCCSIRDDLIEAVAQVLARPEMPQYVILEASGVADPSGIAMSFHNPVLRDRIRLDSIICVLDAEQVFSAPEHMQLKLFQIGFSDLLLLNKVDLVDATQIEKITCWLDDNFSRYRLLQATQCNLPLEVLLAAGRLDAASLDAVPKDRHHSAVHCTDPHCSHDHGHTHGHDNHSGQFSTWSFSSDAPMDLNALRRMVGRLPNTVYRCKGVIFLVEEPGRRAVLQVVGKRVDITLERAWGDENPSSRIVVIGAHGSIDASALRDGFRSCIAQALPA